MTWRFIRVNALRIVIGAVLVAAVYWAICVYSTYQREQRIARKVDSVDGRVYFYFCGPNWIPQSIQKRLALFDRIESVHFVRRWSEDGPFVFDVISDLASLTHHFRGIELANAQITDAELQRLKGLTNMEALILQSTSVTDTGLEHLKGLTSLKELYLDNTKTTPKGRAMLRKALPICKIEPDP